MISDNIIYFFYDLGGTWEGRQKIKKAIFFFGGGAGWFHPSPPASPTQSLTDSGNRGGGCSEPQSTMISRELASLHDDSHIRHTPYFLIE
jgi:hypothetical protein